jgi:2-polyprenyl-3-methyl-5-hydroxy-6-metoxy-1,4-benzoquinol methylase
MNNKEVWEKVYKEGVSRLIYPDEVVVSEIEKYCRKKQFKDGYALDLGCGCGRHSFLLLRYGFKVIGVDSSISAIEFANNIKEQEGYKECLFIQFNIEDYILSQKQKHKYEVIICWGLIHYLKESSHDIILSFIKDNLASEGIFLGTFRSIEDSKYRSKEDYFRDIKGTKMEMIFWDENSLRDLLSKHFSKFFIGKRLVQPIGHDFINAHWLVKAEK